jgi:lipopolysaccharide export system protein LptC
MNGLERLRRLLDRLTIYLPLILFALLALSSWWLVRSMPELLPQQVDKQLRQDPDYRLDQFTVKSFDASGRMVREVAGATATHFPTTQALHIQNIEVFAENDKGIKVRARAQQGIFTESDNRFTLQGQARMTRTAQAPSGGNPPTAPLSLQGERLTVWMNEERLQSDLPVELRRGNEVITAQSLNFDTRSGQYELQGRVRAVLPPRQSP